jgi:hypothetical protein
MENNSIKHDFKFPETIKITEYKKVFPKYQINDEERVTFIDNVDYLETFRTLKKNILDIIESNSSITKDINSNVNIKFELRTKECQESKPTFESSTNTTTEDHVVTVTPDKELIQAKSKELIRIISDDNTMIGYTSTTELYINSLFSSNRYLAGDVIISVQREIYDKPILLAKLIEAVSNLDYDLLNPYNFTIVQASLSHKDIEVQEAVVAAYEKWEDPQNAIFLEHSTYDNEFIHNYAQEVISYLKGL